MFLFLPNVNAMVVVVNVTAIVIDVLFHRCCFYYFIVADVNAVFGAVPFSLFLFLLLLKLLLIFWYCSSRSSLKSSTRLWHVKWRFKYQ